MQLCAQYVFGLHFLLSKNVLSAWIINISSPLLSDSYIKAIRQVSVSNDF